MTQKKFRVTITHYYEVQATSEEEAETIAKQTPYSNAQDCEIETEEIK